MFSLLLLLLVLQLQTDIGKATCECTRPNDQGRVRSDCARTFGWTRRCMYSQVSVLNVVLMWPGDCPDLNQTQFARLEFIIVQPRAVAVCNCSFTQAQRSLIH